MKKLFASACALALSAAMLTGCDGADMIDTYQKIEDAAVNGYQAMEDAVVDGYQRIEDAFVDKYLEPEATGEN